MKNINEALNWRYATKKFNTTKKLTDEQVNDLLNVARLSPSSFGTQPWKFILVENKELREKLKEASYGQPQITDASHLIVFAYKTNYSEKDLDEYIKSTGEIQGVSVESLSDLKNSVMGGVVNTLQGDALKTYASNQTHIAFGFLLEAAALMEIDACPMGGFNPDAYDEILGLKELGLHAMTIAAIGYRDETDETLKHAKSRFKMEEVVIRR